MVTSSPFPSIFMQQSRCISTQNVNKCSMQICLNDIQIVINSFWKKCTHTHTHTIRRHIYHFNFGEIERTSSWKVSFSSQSTFHYWMWPNSFRFRNWRGFFLPEAFFPAIWICVYVCRNCTTYRTVGLSLAIDHNYLPRLRFNQIKWNATNLSHQDEWFMRTIWAQKWFTKSWPPPPPVLVGPRSVFFSVTQKNALTFEMTRLPKICQTRRSLIIEDASMESFRTNSKSNLKFFKKRQPNKKLFGFFAKPSCNWPHNVLVCGDW